MSTESTTLHSLSTADHIFSYRSPSPSSSFTSADYSKDHHWSEVVPPMSALTFAAIWDPTDGLITFSGARLLDSDPKSDPTTAAAPSDAYDARSQVLTIDHFFATEHTRDTVAEMDSYFGSYLSPMLSTPAAAQGQQRASTTLGGADVYLRDSFVSANAPRSRQYSVFGALDEELRFDATTAFAGFSGDAGEDAAGWSCEDASRGSNVVTDEGYFELDGHRCSSGSAPHSGTDSRCLKVPVVRNLGSHFSVSTTSTSEYIQVNPTPARQSTVSSFWTALEAPRTPAALTIPAPTPVPASELSHHRTLKKRRRPPHTPRHANTAVLSWVSVLSSDRASGSSRPLSALVRKVGSMKRNRAENESERWVCIEVEHRIKQRIM